MVTVSTKTGVINSYCEGLEDNKRTAEEWPRVAQKKGRGASLFGCPSFTFSKTEKIRCVLTLKDLNREAEGGGSASQQEGRGRSGHVGST
jgi:hypothetical protein